MNIPKDQEATQEELDAFQPTLEQDNPPDPYQGDDWDGVQDLDAVDPEDEAEQPRSLLSTAHFAGNNAKEAAAYLLHQQQQHANWRRMCLMLQRSARDIPALAPTAFAAATITPISERVHKVSDLRRGMVGFHKGADPAGHVYYILGRRPKFDADDPHGVLTKGNDVVSSRPGEIGVVSLAFFHEVWGYDFLFGATMLNNYDFSDFNAKPKPVHATLGGNYLHAMEDMRKAIAAQRKAHHDTLVAGLRRDLARMERRYANHKPK